MQPWIIDAHDIELTSFSQFDGTLLHRTPTIDAFLSAHDRAEVAIVGPKGFGKTLLVQCKRLQLSEAKPGVRALPHGSLVDKPAATPPKLNTRQVEYIAKESSFWRTLWTVAFMLCFIKEQERDAGGQHLDEKRLKSSTIKRIAKSDTRPSAVDIFSELLSESQTEYFNIDADLRAIIPTFRSIHTPMYLFLDNVDEFFGIHLTAKADRAAHGSTRADFWHNSQIGAIQAARQIAHTNRHIRVFCSIRSEALERAVETEEMATQLRGSCLELEYTRDDLREILLKNIQREPRSNLRCPEATDPFVQWVGEESKALRHPTTDESEPISDYIIRHTLLRPRDVAVIGREISRIRPSDRSPQRIKTVVNRAAADLVKAYLQECEPHLLGFDVELLLKLFEANYLTREQLEQVQKQYVERYAEKHNDEWAEAEGVVLSMYRVGLLGYVGRDAAEPNIDRQVFLRPGGRAFASKVAVPEAAFYLLHPGLSDLIAAKHKVDFIRRRNRMNIIGGGRIWRNDSDGYFVVRGDIEKFSELMMRDDYTKLANVLYADYRRIAGRLSYCSELEGDGFTVADQSAPNVIEVLREISRRLALTVPDRRIRFGGDFGFVELPVPGRTGVTTGLPLRTAARVQEKAKPGTLLATKPFFEHLTQRYGLALSIVRREEMNIAKQSEDPEMKLLWEIDLEA